MSFVQPRLRCLFFFFNDTATTEIYTPFPTRRSSDLLRLGEGATAALFTGSRCVSAEARLTWATDRKSTRLNSSHDQISYAVFCLKKKKKLTRAIARHNSGWAIITTRMIYHTYSATPR